MQFQQLIGQAEPQSKLFEAIQRGRMPHALLVTGPEGIGKLPFIHALAQYVNCLNPSEKESCGQCSNCIKIQKGIHPDIHYIYPIIAKVEGGKRLLSADYMEEFRKLFFTDPYISTTDWQLALGGANKQLSIHVHEIRALKRRMYLKAFEAKYKIVIIWQADKINREASNAFLKLLEEPPEQTLLLMTCSDPTRLLTTINSRCQRFKLDRISPDYIQQYLQDQKELSPTDAADIAAISAGSISQANMHIAETTKLMGDTYQEWLRAIYMGDYVKISASLDKVYDKSKEFQKAFLAFAARQMRESLMFHVQMETLAYVTEEGKKFHQRFAKVINPNKVEMITKELDESRRFLQGNANAQMVFTSLSLKIHFIVKGNY